MACGLNFIGERGGRVLLTTLALVIHATPARAQDRLADAGNFIETAFSRIGLPGGAAVLVVDGEMRFVSYGTDSSGIPITPDTPFYVGSLSKAFAAAAAVKLSEEGKLDLDAPITQYLGLGVIDDARGSQITTRLLLHHVSGLTNQGYDEWSRPQPRNSAEFLARVRRARVGFDPGSRFSYHNPNYELVAAIVERVSGMPYSDYLKGWILAPVGMDQSISVAWVDEARDGVARGHIRAFGRFIEWKSPGRFYIEGAGGVVTTPRDYARWLAMEMNGGVAQDGARILSAAAVAASHTPIPASVEYGFGWNRRGNRVSHSGGLPTFSAYAAMEGGTAVALFAPVVPVGVPGREIGLGALDLLNGRTPAPIDSGRIALLLDYLAAVLSVAVLIRGARSIATAGRWVQDIRRRRRWRRIVSFLVSILPAGNVMIGVPFVVSKVVSWSWLWLFFYLPVWVAFMAILSLASFATTIARALAFLSLERGEGIGRL